ncbi:MAG: DUF99 family protein [Candidatus Thermoplasmatota archaeon]|nr:DUF99 family protein [Candidatus Thermoplasmatota archaeon]
MKTQVRILGIDDSPFRFKDEKALVVGALIRLPNYLEGVMRTEVTVDGTDSTDKLLEMVSRSRYKEQVKAAMIDGIALAGFNIVDVERLHSELGVPVITITRDRPDFGKMRSALMKHFQDWEARYSMVTRLELREIETQQKPVYACVAGLDWEEAVRLVAQSTVRGVVPEPIRVAHLISSAMVRGESYGRS